MESRIQNGHEANRKQEGNKNNNNNNSTYKLTTITNPITPVKYLYFRMQELSVEKSVSGNNGFAKRHIRK